MFNDPDEEELARFLRGQHRHAAVHTAVDPASTTHREPKQAIPVAAPENLGGVRLWTHSEVARGLTPKSGVIPVNVDVGVIAPRIPRR